MRKLQFWLLLLSLGIYLFLYIPLIAVALFSFNQGSSATSFEGWSFRWYEALFEDQRLLKALWSSLLVAGSATAISICIGVLMAIGLARNRFIGKRFLNLIVQLPIVLPDIVLGIATLCFLSFVDWSLGLSSIICAHVTFCTAFVVLVVSARLASFNHHLEDAARDLGASECEVFRFITLPLIAPAVAAGALLSFTLSFDDFTVSFFTSGVGATTLPIRVFSMLHFGVTPIINAVSTILIVISFVLVFTASRLFGKMQDL